MLVPLIVLTFAFVTSEARGPKGAEWSDQDALIIKNKLKNLWYSSVEFFDQFDPYGDSATSSEYVYDPGSLTEPLHDCICRTSNCNCYGWTGPTQRRKEDLAFTIRKTLRLAFHDCFLYRDNNEGGCDGCLNLDENVDGNNGLQYTAAILERVYLDKDFPPQPEHWPQLQQSPQEMGISRADLWSFAGLVALDESLAFSKSYCKHDPFDLNCGDNTSSCFTPLPGKYIKLFKTGRQDCTPKEDAGPLHQYRARYVEVHPKEGGNGEMTVQYFKDNFKLNGRETVALMGAHTIGKFNPITAHRDYAWVRSHSRRIEVFNNEYYKIVSQEPAYIQEAAGYGNCFGKIDGSPGAQTIDVFANAFTTQWASKRPWATPEDPGILTWKSHYFRQPLCHKEARDDDEYVVNSQHLDRMVREQYPEFQGSGRDWCCQQIVENNCNETTTGCPEECNVEVGNRIRMTSPDMGLYYKWQIDENGLPYGCGIFNLTPHTVQEFGRSASLGNSDCPMQDIPEKKGGMLLYQRVESYAQNQELWINDFTNVYGKMITNNNKKLSNGPKNFWSYECCFESYVQFWSNNINPKKIQSVKNVSDAFECQRQCQQSTREPCKYFLFNSMKNKCELLRAELDVSPNAIRTYNAHFIAGPVTCENMNKCEGMRFGVIR